MESQNHVLTEVLNFIHGYFGETRVVPETALIKEAILDSIRTMELVYFVERKFSIEIPPHCMVSSNFETPAAVAQMVGELAPQGS